MTTEVLDVSQLPARNTGRAEPLYWGMWGLMAIETIVVASLISSYLYFRVTNVEWPPAGVPLPKLLLPTLNTVLLIASGVVVHFADAAIQKGNQRGLSWGLGVGLVMAVAFLVLKFVELSSHEYRWSSHAYGSISYALSGFHTAHVIILVLKTVVMLSFALRGYFNAERNLGVQLNGLYWNFVVVIWLPIYAVLYLAPRVLS